MSYPCTCSPSQIQPPPSGGCPSGVCIFVPSLVISGESAPNCGNVAFTIDMAANSDLSACSGDINWALFTTWDHVAFSSMSIDSDGVIHGVTTADAVPATFYILSGLATCSNSLLSTYFTVSLPIANPCGVVLCEDGQACLPCTGECSDIIPDAVLT